MKFKPRGLLMMNAETSVQELDCIPQPDMLTHDQLAIVQVRGPLEHHANGSCCAYESVKAQWASAHQDPQVRAVMLDIDSPGGLTSGCFQAVQDMRAIAKDSGKRTVAYMHNGLSASYALGMSCDEVYAAQESMIGSIGVIQHVGDRTRMNDGMGLSVHIISSGARKADGDPNQPFDDDVRESLQSTVDAVAGVFHSLVAERRGLSAEVIAGMQGKQYPGEQAQALGLTDGTMTRDQCLALIARNEAPPGGSEDKTMTAEEKKEMLAALTKAVSDGEVSEEEAKEALGLTSEDGDEEEPKSEDDKEEPKSEDDKEEPKSEDDKEEKTALAAVSKLEAKFDKFLSGQQVEKEAAQKAELLASRTDFSPEIRKTLMAGTLEAVQDAVKNWKPMTSGSRAASALAGLGANPTQGGNGSALPQDEDTALKMRMGVIKTETSVVDEGHRQIFGVLVPKVGA